MKKIKLFISLLALSSMISLSSCSNNTPYVGSNGNWWIGNSDLGIPATGPKGDTGATGPKGDKGDAVTVVSVEKIKTEGINDIYEISFSDGTKKTFTVTNGTDGASISVVDVSLKSSENGIDTYEILFSDGYTTTFTVTNGKDLSVLSIEKVSTNGLFDTYRINYSDGKYIEFVVGNGATPYIGENGHWWINDVDTGVIADYSKEDSRKLNDNNKICSAGLVYTPMTIRGQSGYIVSDFNSSLAKTFALNNYKDYSKDLTKNEYANYVDTVLNNMEIVIPNYIGATPVIGIGESAFAEEKVKSISISKNTIYLGKKAFYHTSILESFDFNQAPITYISEYCFSNSTIQNIVLPSSVKTLYDYAFEKCELSNLDLSNITYFGSYSLNGLLDNYVWLSKDVEYVGHNAFNMNFVYIEKGTDYSTWNDSGDVNNILYDSYYDIGVIENCYKNEDLIYAMNEENGITAYKWLKEEKVIEVPSMINNKSVTRLGYGFANDFSNVYDAIRNDKVSNSLKRIEQVKLPKTIKRIEIGALELYGAMIYIPSSVEKIYAGTCAFGNNYRGLSYLAFESNSLPNFISGSYNEAIITPEQWLNDSFGKYAKYGLGLDFNQIQYSKSNCTFYYMDELQASLLTCMDLDSSRIETDETFAERSVKTIMTKAFSSLPNLKIVKIGENVNRIQKYAFSNLNLEKTFIPSSVSIISKYGFNSCCKQYYIGATAIPDDWDSLWAGTTSPNVTYNSTLDDLINE